NARGRSPQLPLAAWQSRNHSLPRWKFDKRRRALRRTIRGRSLRRDSFPAQVRETNYSPEAPCCQRLRKDRFRTPRTPGFALLLKFAPRESNLPRQETDLRLKKRIKVQSPDTPRNTPERQLGRCRFGSPLGFAHKLGQFPKKWWSEPRKRGLGG